MSGAAKDHTGKRFGMWTVLHRSESNKKGRAAWLCRCDCGTERTVAVENLTRGKSKSCGCSSGSLRSASLRIHGHTRMDGYMSPTYKSWHAMRQRCKNKNTRAYPDYGGRGICVCPEWKSFEVFLKDMGERPESKTLDRIRVNENYGPENCRWSTRKEQASNKRPTVSHRQIARLVNAARVVVAANDNVTSEINALREAIEEFEGVSDAA